MAAPAGSQSRILLALLIGAFIGCMANYWVEASMPAEAKEERQRISDAKEKRLKEAAAAPEAKAPAKEEKPKIEWTAQQTVRFITTYITGPLGSIFISLLFMAIIPLVFASLALGVTRLGGEANLGRIGFKTITYFILTTICAGLIGLTMVNWIEPGKLKPEQAEKLKQNAPSGKAVGDGKPATFGIETFVNIVPRNPLKSFTDKEMLAIIFTALFVGIALMRIEASKAKPIVDLLEGVNAVTDFIIRTAMAFAPIGVFCLIFTNTALFGIDLLEALAKFMITVFIGLAIQLLIVFPVLVYFLGGMNPIEFFKKSWVSMVTAFSTSSSSATLPTAMKTAEEDLGVSPRVSRFVLPLSASMNHNGTALFEAVTAVFLCQLFGLDLNIQQQLIVLVLCVLTATGMAGVPGGSLPLIGLVIAAVDPNKVVPAEAIAIVLGVDRILDMTRTMVNVTGDLTTALYVNHSAPKDEPVEVRP